MKRFCLAVPLAAAVLLAGCAGGDTVAHLDGHPVSLEEYRQYAYDSISLVSAEYNRTYGADPNAADFWTTAYDGVTPMQTLLEIELDYPINAMTRICKKFSLPKKEALEAIAMFQTSYGGGTATAHDVFMALQEIPWLMKLHNYPEAKMLTVEENMARALSIKWSEYDLAKAVSY